MQVVGPDGADGRRPDRGRRYADGLPRAYFPLRVTIDEPGIYTARTEIDGAATEMAFQVDSPDDVKVIQPGAAMPSLETPTTTDARGVDPVCTSEPACPLHDVTLAEALAEGAPVALLVATPAFCQIAICGPVLDVLLDVRDDQPRRPLPARRGVRRPGQGPRRRMRRSSTPSVCTSSRAWCSWAPTASWSTASTRSTTASSCSRGSTCSDPGPEEVRHESPGVPPGDEERRRAVRSPRLAARLPPVVSAACGAERRAVCRPGAGPARPARG